MGPSNPTCIHATHKPRPIAQLFFKFPMPNSSSRKSRDHGQIGCVGTDTEL